MTTTPIRKFISPHAAAETLDVNVREIYRFISAGHLPATRLSHKAIRIAEADLHAFVEARRIIALRSDVA